MDAILAIAEKHNLKVIEDCAQAVGATYKGKYVGTMGDCGCFSFQYHKTITAGEGGMILCKDARIYDRCCSYHDTAACWRPDRFAEQRYEGELFCGSNFRMSELAGAVMLAQLGRLDYLNAAMRSHQKRIIEQIKDTKGIKVRPCNDPEGDTGICLMFYLDAPEKVGPFCDALKAEGVNAAGVFNSGIPDWHIYGHWKHVIQKKTSSPVCCPYDCPYHAEKAEPVEYAEDMNPKTLEYLGKVVHLDIPAQMTDEDCDMIAKAINKVAAVLA
jgi:8-amino-3,8-dideoxy-alpha-D-manno-octulosonate transaminase